MNLDYRLSERKRTLLSAIVKDYITHGEPLGSRTLAQRYGFSFSPATIRNEMAELEEVGLLHQPHTSAGRVPSAKGYRFYVDYLMDAYVPNQEEQQFIRRLEQTSRAVDAILEQGIRILSEATQTIAVAETPRMRRDQVSQLQLTLVDSSTLVLGLHYRSGIRKQSLVHLSQPVLADILALLTQYLNRQLSQNHSLETLFHRMATSSLERDMQAHRTTLLEMVAEMYAQTQRDERVHLAGTSHLLREPEFQSMAQAFPILQFFEHEQFVHELFHNCAERHLQKSHHVYCLIGEENAYTELQHCSFVATPYFIERQMGGMIGVLGPIGMDYPKVMALLQTVAGNISTALSQLYC